MRGTFLGVMAAVLLPLAASAVTIDLVTVGDPGNAPDPLNTNSVPGIGSVAYTYGIGKYEVFNSQYVDFLNAVADTDTYGLYSSLMNSDARGGIVQSGSSGSFTYSLKSGYENMPVVYVSFYDAVRFANWLENGQPTGAQGAGTTETGSYTLFTSGSSTTNVSARAANATWVIPTENEWYKAAYYDPTASGTTNYWLYPTQSDAIPNSRPPNGTDANSANFYRDDGSPDDFLNDGYAKTGSTSFNNATNYLTAVGSYSVADSYYGTFDQGGNVWEWDETIISGSIRGLRGGRLYSFENALRSSFRDGNSPSLEDASIGFRVAAIPEPGGFVALALAGLAGLAWRRRRWRGESATIAAVALGLMCLPTPGRALTMSTVTVSNLNNPADSTGYGSVGYVYGIGTFEIYNSQYAEFLNAVADTDTYGLYSTSMGSDARGGITRSGSSGSYTYSVKANMGNKPVNYVSYYDAVRFANWMANGQPTGGQTSGVTETGSYTLTGATSVGAREANATWIIPTENEWYKAAYYDPSPSGPSDDYWLYPVRSDSVPLHTIVDASGNVVADPGTAANYGSASDWNGQDGNVTSYAYNSASYYGTFDQGGNVNEWTETILGSFRVLRGGGWANSEAALRATTQGFDSPTVEDVGLGFRLALIPEPGPIAAFGLLGLAAVAHRLRRRKKDFSHGGTEARRKSLASEAPRSAQVPLAPCKAAVALPHSASGAREVRMDASHGGSLPAIRRAETRRGTPNSSAYSACSAVALLVALLFLAPPSRAVTIDLVAVGDPGNAPDPLNTNAVPGIGSVSYSYSIGKFEVFNSQYVEFLNAVADTDTYGLYNVDMASDARGGIVQSGSSGSYTYAVKSGYDNMPVVYVSFYDAVRFANWLENGQPTGAQAAGTTETGSYTLFTSGTSTTNVSARAANATWVIPTENEWYKAAYYDPTASGTTNYWLYPMQTDSIPYSDQPPGTSSPDASIAGNFYSNDGSANGYNDGFAKTGSTSNYGGTNYLTDVGAYTSADSYYGTFDQSGNVAEWNETIIGSSTRGWRDSHWSASEVFLRSSSRSSNAPEVEGRYWGFRVAAIPEPGAFGALAAAALAACVWQRRRR